MNCPLCHQRLYAVGESGFDKPIGYNCPTTIEMSTGPISDPEKRELYDHKAIITHYETRGARTIINLPEDYRIVTWSDPMESYGHSTILRFVWGYGYKDVFHCRELPIESPEKLLARIKLLAVFS